jgi:hypothetical protein
MPRRMTATKEETQRALTNISYENIVVGWLMQDGWQVFTPVLDNGHKTDILISDGPHFHRLQIKTGQTSNEEYILENRWKDSDVDVVIFFARNSNWGYVMPAFTQNKRKVNSEGHQRFQENKNDFLKAFHKL